MKFTDTDRLDFLEKWDTSSHQNTWFTLLTQHVKKQDYPTLRSFCDHAIGFERMIDLNGLDIMAWHYLPPHLQEKVTEIWEKEFRHMSEEEKESLVEESTRYWEELHQTESQDQDK